MSWYYAGPDARPVGPISLEELNARCASGALSPETYVIEQPSSSGQAPAWRRYRELFPATSPTLPPLPALPPGSPPSTGPAAHPLFPSATYSTSPGGPVFTGAHPSSYRLEHPSNPWCSWGFGLGLASLLLLIVCVGVFLAPLSLLASTWGLVQLHRHPEQTGRGLAITGIVFSLLTLLIVFVAVASYIGMNYHVHGWTVTEQTTTDSD